MSQANFSRVHNWATEILQFADLNTEFNNILTNFNPQGMGAYSDTIAQMQKTTSPGATGTESLATSLGGELERLRFCIKRLGGASLTNWYDNPPTSISNLVTSLGSTLPNNYLVSGITTGNSSQLASFVPGGGTVDTITLNANATTPFVYFINAVQYTIGSNVTVSGLTLAPTSNATAVTLDPVMAGQQWTQLLGMYGTQILVNSTAANIGSNVSNLAGQIAGYSVGTEYFIGKYNSTVGSIQSTLRGGFLTAASVAAPAVTIGNNAVITLQKLTWLYATTAAGVAIAYTNPTISASQPSSPSIGDYWFNLNQTANQWYTYNGTSWNPAGATLAGMCMQNTVGCVAARTFDPYKGYADLNSINLQWLSGTQAVANDRGSQINVFGTTVNFDQSQPLWDITQNLDSGTVGASSYYYYYVKESGAPLISLQPPIYRRAARGLYHPAEAYRCIAQAQTNTASAVVVPVKVFRSIVDSVAYLSDPTAYSQITGGTRAAVSVYNSFPLSFKFANVSALSVTTNSLSVFQTAAAITLDPGMWELSSYGMFALGAGGPVGVLALGIGLTTGSAFATAESVLGFNTMYAANVTQGSANANYVNVSIPNYRVNASAPTNYYLYVANSIGISGLGPAVSGTITARRLDNVESTPT